MKKVLFFSLLMISAVVYAQLPEDALRYSFYPQNGTARSLAIGGAMGSLGGDISTIYVNPAGLGNYRTKEFVFSPQWFNNNNKINYRGANNQSNAKSFGVGASGFVIGYGDSHKENTSHAFSIAVTQTANFNNSIHYSGYNNYSSYAEQWAEQIGESGDPLNTVLSTTNPHSPYVYGTAPALYTYLVDTVRLNDTTLRLRAMPEFVLDQGKALLQENDVETSGGIYEIAIGYATNKNDKFLFGGSLGIPIVYYQNNTTYSETDTSTDTNNNFAYFKYTDNSTTTGAGINLKLGAIYKPTEYLRIGVAVHSPTYMLALKNTRSTYLEAQTENYNGLAAIGSNYFTGGQPGENKYHLLTPFKTIVSGSYVFRESEDVTQQRAFVTADIEYVNTHGSSFSSAESGATASEKDYFTQLNGVVKDQYKGTFNFRAGGELKFNIIMARLGFAYYGNPYKDPALKANKTLLSGGLGYRNNGIFIDLTYIYSINKDVNFPYRLEDKSNTYANIKDQHGDIVATVGFKF
jgi:hypothetical protein